MKKLLICGAFSAVFATTLAAYRVYGEIGKKYAALGGPAGWLGQPLNDETGTPDGVGRFNRFEHGMIYWTPGTGAHEVHGAILDKWSSMGFERSVLGYPNEDEQSMGDGRGRFSNFQGGSMFWTAKTGAHFMSGPVMPKWVRLKGSRGFLGYPVSDEMIAPDGKGHFVHFEGGSIYWSSNTGAHEVRGAIRDRWAALGWEKGRLGYPRSDEYQDGEFRRSDFQHGCLRWSARTGVTPLNCVAFDNGTALNPAQN